MPSDEARRQPLRHRGVPRVLVLNAAPAGAQSEGVIGVVTGSEVIVEHRMKVRGASEAMATVVQSVLDVASIRDIGPDAIVVVRGPGSFTGVRASLALAEGLAAGYGCPLHGITIGACHRAMTNNEAVWSISEARRNRVFVESPGGKVWAGAPDDIEIPLGARVAGDSVQMLPERLKQLVEIPPMLSEPIPILVLAQVGLASAPQRALDPLYIDPPEAKPPASGFRPSPIA